MNIFVQVKLAVLIMEVAETRALITRELFACTNKDFVCEVNTQLDEAAGFLEPDPRNPDFAKYDQAQLRWYEEGIAHVAYVRALIKSYRANPKRFDKPDPV